ncbi:MAG: replication-associated recombination protein A [bacterium]|nr:replication-associated recombination protein A [bacterium]
MTLFDKSELLSDLENENLPLAARLRPPTISEMVGQSKLLSENGAITRMLRTRHLHSFILWGPPGCGKTTLARALANELDVHFREFSAVTSTVADVRQVVKEAREVRKLTGIPTILFVDELHRFNKLQQDAFLPHIEDGTIVLIGATTENPYFSINSALRSRLTVYKLEPLDVDDLKVLSDRVLGYFNNGRDEDKRYILADEVRDSLLMQSGGDARTLIGTLEVAKSLADEKSGGNGGEFTHEVIESAMQSAYRVYDRTGDMHYDTISAFIKSMRGSDPDAAIYYLAKMLASGEDPKFIARRLVIQAAEDVGNANPMALVVANAAREAVEFVGMPEAQIPLAQATIYIATSPKSNSSVKAIGAAMSDIEEGKNYPPPLSLRNAPVKEMKTVHGHSEGYKYAHSFPGGVADMQYLPDEMLGTEYYDPSDRGKEKAIREWLEKFRAARNNDKDKK